MKEPDELSDEEKIKKYDKMASDTRFWGWVIIILIPTLLVISGVKIVVNYLGIIKPEPTITQRIQQVENAVKSLNDLEKYLEILKEDMIATQQAKEEIEREYTEVKSLQSLSQEQLKALNLVITRKSLTDKVLDNFWGFIFGVTSSIVASWMWEKYKNPKNNQEAAKE